MPDPTHRDVGDAARRRSRQFLVLSLLAQLVLAGVIWQINARYSAALDRATPGPPRETEGS